MKSQQKIHTFFVVMTALFVLSACSLPKIAKSVIPKSILPNTYSYSSEAQARKLMISGMDAYFKGKHFTIVSTEKGAYSYDKDLLETYVKDQDGLTAHVELTNHWGLTSDYLMNYYTRKSAAPIEKLLTPLSFVKNIAVQEEYGDNSGVGSGKANLSLTPKDYWQNYDNHGSVNTGSQLTVMVFLPMNETKSQYVAQTLQIYNLLYDKQSAPFELEICLQGDRIGPIVSGAGSQFAGPAREFMTYYIYDNANNKIAPIRTTQKMMEKDLDPDRYYDEYHQAVWSDYEMTWLHQPVMTVSGLSTDDKFPSMTQSDYDNMKVGNSVTGAGGASVTALCDKFGSPDFTDFASHHSKTGEPEHNYIAWDGFEYEIAKVSNNNWYICRKVKDDFSL